MYLVTPSNEIIISQAAGAAKGELQIETSSPANKK